MVSRRSITVSAISIQLNSSAAASCSDQPKRQTQTADTAALSSSTSGYWIEIAVRQLAQRPRSASQDSTGMFCHGRIAAPQPGQHDAG